MATAPHPEIQSGRTTWVLSDDGVYYQPKGMTEAAAVKARWRYHFDKQSLKMYFSNAAGAVEWKLPDVAPPATANSAAGAATAAAVPPTDGLLSSDNAEIRALTTRPATAEPVSSSDAIRQRIQERIKASRSPSPAVMSTTPVDRAATTNAPPATTAVEAPRAVVSAVGALAATEAATTTTTASPTGAAEGGSSGAAGGANSYWKDRLNRHRSKTLSPMTTRSPSMQSQQAAGSPTVARGGVLGPAVAQELQIASSTERAPEQSPAPANPASAASAAAFDLAPGEQIVPAPAVLDKAALEERRRHMVASDAALQAERAEVIRLERLALDRQRAAAAELARQEEEHLAIVAKRRELEARRQAIEQEAFEQAQARRLNAAARAAALAAGVDAEALPEEDLAADSAAQQLRRSADSKIRASHEFASALSLAMLEELQQDNDDLPDTQQLDTDLAGLKKAEIRYDNAHRYTGTMRGKQKHGQGKYFVHPSDHYFYEGDWRADKKHGSGVASLQHVLYEGEWKSDRPSGKGLLHTQRMQASGTFSNGVAHGNVVAQLATGESFGGKFKSNSAASPGALTLSAGDRIEWRSADPSIPGTGSALVAYASGDSYSGEIADWKLHGRGQYYFSDTRDTYVGTFAKGEFTGTGTYTFAADQSVYDGALLRGAFHGSGRYATAEAVYDGEWVEGKMHGKGTITYANGDVWKGTFENDRRVRGKYVFSKSFILA